MQLVGVHRKARKWGVDSISMHVSSTSRGDLVPLPLLVSSIFRTHFATIGRNLDMAEPAYKKISIAKQAERQSKIPKEWRITVPEGEGSLLNLPRQCGIFTEQELAITETMDSVELLNKIHSGLVTSMAVTQAFCKVRTQVPN